MLPHSQEEEERPSLLVWSYSQVDSHLWEEGRKGGTEGETKERKGERGRRKEEKDRRREREEMRGDGRNI